MTFPRRGAILVAMAVLSTGAGSGCGGSDGSGETSASTDSAGNTSSTAAATKPIRTNSLTKAQFIDRADSICANVEVQVGAGAQVYAKRNPSAAKQSEAEQVAAMADSVLIPAMQAGIDGIRALGAPRGEEKQVEAIVVAMQEGNDNAKESHITSYTQFGNEFRKSSQLAEQYGIEGCIFSSS